MKDEGEGVRFTFTNIGNVIDCVFPSIPLVTTSQNWIIHYASRETLYNVHTDRDNIHENG